MDRREAIEFTFSIAVPGIAADYLRRDFADTRCRPSSLVDCDVPTLVERLRSHAASHRQPPGHDARAIRSTWS